MKDEPLADCINVPTTHINSWKAKYKRLVCLQLSCIVRNGELPFVYSSAEVQHISILYNTGVFIIQM